MPTTKLKLFLDANVLIAGSASLTGGSAFILQACQKGLFQAITTELILLEAERNITNKLGRNVLDRFYKLIKSIPLILHSPATTIDKYQHIIAAKDAHVLASAVESQSDYLITLDRRHFFTLKIKKAGLAIKIVTPKDFIQSRR